MVPWCISMRADFTVAVFRAAQAWAGALVDTYYGEDYGLEDSQ